MDKKIIIQARDITKSYTMEKKTFEAVKGASIDIYENEISVIIGASGAGKSTLLHILGALDKPTAGSVLVDNVAIHTLNEKEISKLRSNKIGFVFQFHHLLPEFTADENIAIPLMLNGKSKRQALHRAHELLELTGLRDRAHHKPAELSGGEQQRVAIARALANDPQIIFADEPTGNLDSSNSEIINNLFVTLRDDLKKTFVIVTHNTGLMKLADRIFEIKDGIIHDIQSSD
jgi:lipoprotein-releasing system ATP-binding protein